jgi:predicted DNA-binding transcriptional regulator YafY
MLSIPEPLARLGVDKHLRAAMRKLAASLPDARRDDEQRVRQRFLLDATWWLEDDERVPHMQLLQEAVWHDRTLLVTYRAPVVGDMTALIEPYGLVAKAGLWHLVFARAGRTRVERVSALLEVHQTGEAFDRPAGFDLESFWREWCAEHQAELVRYRVTVRVRPGSMAELRWRLGSRVRAGSQPGAGANVDGGECLDLTFESLEEAREKLLGLGRGVEVIHPFALRRSVRDYAAQVLAVYDSP